MPVSVQLDLVSGGQAEFQLPDPDPFPSSYFISMEHSGNGEFWSVAMKILGAANRSVCRFGESLQKAGITRRDVSRSAMRSLLQTNGYAFGMFREIDPGLMDLDLSDRNTFLFVRDPRDVVLSTYLATESKRSASAGATEESSAGDPDSSSLPILDFVRSAEVDNLARRYQRFAQFGGTARNVTVFRYEDVMFSWRQLVADLVDRLNLRISRESAFAIADSVPALADLSRLAAIGPRRWIPAFREYLDETSIADLEEKFAYPMAFFGYAPEGRPSAAFLDHQAEFLRAVSERFSIAHTQCLHLAVRAPGFGPQPHPRGGAGKPAPAGPPSDPTGGIEGAQAGAAGSLLLGMVGPDPVLSWRLRPHTSCEQTVLGRQVVMEVDGTGCRRVAGQPLSSGKTLAAYGCSVTFGWALPAEETFCSLLQSMFPAWRVENHGVGAYSATQNLIQLERDSRWSTADYVTFCWVPHHMLRNVADPAWLQLLMGKTKERQAQGILPQNAAVPAPQPTFPRSVLDGDGEVHYRLIKFPRWDLVGIDWTDFSPDPYYLDLVCFSLFKRAAEIVNENGGHFFVTTLQGQLSRQLQGMLHDCGIPVVDASVTGKEYTCLPDDPHPNALANRIYAEKIRDYVVRHDASPAPFLPSHQANSSGVNASYFKAKAQWSDLAQNRDLLKPITPGPVERPLPKSARSRIDGKAPRPFGHLESDPVLLIRLKPDSSTEMTVLGRRIAMGTDSAGCRSVTGQPQVGERTLAVYGCSLTFGMAIADEETFCSLLQSMFPIWRVENHGVPSYGTTQNLIQLQRESRWSSPYYVTFCWAPDHVLRNVADPIWLQALMGHRKPPEDARGVIQHKADTSQATFPRASLDHDGQLHYRSVKFPRWDLVGIDCTDFSPDPCYLDLVCFELLKRAAEIVKEGGGHFFVTTLQSQLSQLLQHRLKDAGIPVVDASVRGKEYTCLPDDPHPNVLANRIYAQKIRDYLIQHEAASSSEPAARRRASTEGSRPRSAQRGRVSP